MRPSWAGFAGLGVLLAILLGASAAFGVGPLAASVPPDQVTDPKEILARSLQATIDAAAVHLDGRVTGHVPGALVDRPEARLALDGTTIAADARPHDGRTRTSVMSPALGLDLETITVWDGAWYRLGSDGAWQRASLGSASASAGIDINPLTLVDRLRVWLDTPGMDPTSRDVACASASGTCHEVRVDAGTDPVAVLATLLPGERAGSLPRVDTVVTLRTDALTLRPAELLVEARSADGAIDVRLDMTASGWDGDLVIDEPSEPSGSPR
jgi:hypothetical protein